jgi:nucleotide-binding universal stress UspA family protein
VFTVGPHSKLFRADGQFREILYATDFSPESQGAAAYAVSLAQEFQSRLTLLHVIPEQKAGDLVSAADVTASSEKLLRKLVPPEAGAWRKAEYFVERGDPAEKILEFANQREIDLLVLGVRREKGVPGAATHLPYRDGPQDRVSCRCPADRSPLVLRYLRRSECPEARSPKTAGAPVRRKLCHTALFFRSWAATAYERVCLGLNVPCRS